MIPKFKRLFSLLLCASLAAGQQTSGPTGGNTASVSSVAGGSISPSILNNVAQVDGVTNTALAGALFGPQCFAANVNGCKVWDGLGALTGLTELIRANPLIGTSQTRVDLGKGILYTTVPLIVSNDQIYGSGRPSVPTGALSNYDGTSGTVILPCNGADAACGGLYYPNDVPTITAGVMGISCTGCVGGTLPNLSSALTGGGLSNGATVYVQIMPVTNLNTGPDALPCASLPTFTASASVYAGQSICDGTNIEVARNAGTNGSSAPSWAGSKYGTTISGTVNYVNFGAPTGNSLYGSAGFGLASIENAVIMGTTPGTTNCASGTVCTLGLSAPTFGPYPTYATATAYSNTFTSLTAPGMRYVVNAANTHTYLAVGAGTSTGVALSTSPASLTTDVANTLYWKEVGGPTNYLPVAGYLVLMATASGQETVQPTSGCSATVQIGVTTLCAPTATFTLTTAVQTSGNHAPYADSSAGAPVTFGERPDQAGTAASSFMDRLQDLTVDAHGNAGIACLFRYAQELSQLFNASCISGHEAHLVCDFSGCQNASVLDFTMGNPATGNVQTTRAGGIIDDGRDGGGLRYMADGTITDYNPPSALTFGSPACVRGIANSGFLAYVVHGEQCADVLQAGGDAASGTPAGWITAFGISSASGGVGNSTNTVHLLASSTAAGYSGVNIVAEKDAATNSIQDDVVKAGRGNCNSSNSICSTSSGQPYIVGKNNGNSDRTRFFGDPSAWPVQSIVGFQLANLTDSYTAPTISSGFGTSPSIVASNGTAAFTINVGTGGTATSGVIGFPTAQNGWSVHCDDITNPTVGGGIIVKQTAKSTTTATITGYNDAATATAWTASDVLVCSARAY